MEKIYFEQAADAPKPMFCSAVKTGNTVYTSGQLPIDPKTGHMEMEDHKYATELCLDAILRIVEKAGGDKSNIVKMTLLITDMHKVAEINEAYAEFFKDMDVNPARTCIEVANLPFLAPIEIEAILEI